MEGIGIETDGFNENKIQRSLLKIFLHLFRKSLIIPFPSSGRWLQSMEVFSIYLLSMMLELIVKETLGMEGFYYTSTLSCLSFEVNRERIWNRV